MAIPAFKKAEISPGVHVSYIDSWADKPAAELPSSYTTIIGLHGVGFNSAIWTPLLPHLPASTRFIAYNQRSYTGSSPAYQSEKEGGTDATAAYLGDLLAFLEWVVAEVKLPGVDDATSEGGIVLLGWSKGTLLLFSLLSLLHASPSSTTSFISSVQPTSTSLLTSHLRSILLFEPPGSAFGRPPTADYTEAMASVSPPNSSTPSQFADAFAGWIGSYSPPSASSNPDFPSQAPVDQLPPSGLAALDPELLAAAWEPQACAHGFSWRLAVAGDEVATLAKNAIAPPLSPSVPVGFIYGARTNGYCLDAAKTVGGWWGLNPFGEVEGGEKKVVVEGEELEKEKKKVAIKRIEETNHFAFVHQPEAFAKVLEELLDELV
ncbi:Alpha/Beta hydrolase protein [Leucosporidium creatinivorum]|uniref:Alpha/Beta hydrolase protein n=1 Tax=Leucosporidium creatinivorum TaxID=106004 RepID=A0A1Y2D6F7_9BASI|nr:Alpha/Beta hydrolase protein [Leucosporidium creatinivorum]